MYNWVLFQTYYMYFAVFLMLVITWIYSKMNREARNMKAKSSQVEDRSGNYAINE